MNYFNKLILLFVLFFNFSFSQKISIIDSENGNIIPNATVFSKQSMESIISDFNGLVDLNKFSSKDTLIFGHVSYKSLSIVKNEIDDSKVYLIPAAQALNEVVLSVARSKENKSKISKQVSVISYEDLKLNSPQTSADLLIYANGVRVQKSQGGGGSPVIRGFEANRVLLVIDGVRMNNAIYRSGHLQNSITINPNSLERTEVIYGPSSVGYGSDALGGVVHYYTKTPKINNSKEWNFTGVSSYNPRLKNIVQNFDIEYSQKKWASYTNFSFSKFGDIIMGKNRNHGFESWGLDYHFINPEKYNNSFITNPNPNIQKHTSYNQYDFLQKLNFKISDFSSLILNFQNSKSSDIHRFDKLNELKNGNYKYSKWSYGPQKRTMISSQLNLSKKNSFSDKRKLLLAYQKIGESRHYRKFQDLESLNQIESLDVFSINFDLFKNSSDNSSWAYGFEYVFNDISSTAYLQKFVLDSSSRLIEDNKSYDAPTRYPSQQGYYGSIATYYEYRKDISKKSNVNIGMRYTNTQLKAKWNNKEIVQSNLSDVSSNNSSLTTSIGLVYRTTKNWKINGNFSSGFRSPNIDDIGKIREKSGILTVPNPHLKPEYAYNSEIGISKYSKNKLSGFSINAYYTHISKHISRDFYEIKTDQSSDDYKTIIFNSEEVITMANINKGSAYIYGATFDFKTSLSKNLLVKGNLTYTEGRNTDYNHPIPSISPLFGNLLLKLNLNKLETQFSFRFSESKAPEDYSIGGEDGLEETPILNKNGEIYYYGMPSWSVLKLSSSYSFSKRLKTVIILDNLLDVHYREFASGISAPGRNLNIVLSYLF